MCPESRGSMAPHLSHYDNLHLGTMPGILGACAEQWSRGQKALMESAAVLRRFTVAGKNSRNFAWPRPLGSLSDDPTCTALRLKLPIVAEKHECKQIMEATSDFGGRTRRARWRGVKDAQLPQQRLCTPSAARWRQFAARPRSQSPSVRRQDPPLSFCITTRGLLHCLFERAARQQTCLQWLNALHVWALSDWPLPGKNRSDNDFSITSNVGHVEQAE